MRLLQLLGLSLLASGLQAASFTDRQWQPDFQVELQDYFPDETSPRRTVFTCIFSNADLQYLRRGGESMPRNLSGYTFEEGQEELPFAARYEISLEVFELDERERKGRNVTGDYGRWLVAAPDYESTLDRKELRWHPFQVDLPPGDYMWWIEFQDLNTRRSYREDGRMTVHEPGPGWELGRLWKTQDSRDEAENPLELRPAPPRGLEDGSTFRVYYQVRSGKGDRLELGSRILDGRGKVRHENHVERDYPQGVSHNQFQIPLQELGAGEYTLELSLDDGAHKRTSSTRFNVRWQNGPVSREDLDTAIAQLRYIAGRRDLKDMQNSRPPHNRNLFEQFWERYDPDPETEENELKEEYYDRVAVSNASFAWARFPGWKSDRGRVYILYGEPTTREFYEESFEKPAMERWVYAENDREYYFVDEHGFGEFRLVPELELQR